MLPEWGLTGLRVDFCYPHRSYRAFENYTDDLPLCPSRTKAEGARGNRNSSSGAQRVGCCIGDWVARSPAIAQTLERATGASEFADADVPAYVRAAWLARRHRIYIVINLADRKYCTREQVGSGECHAVGRMQYNTNLVFDRNGCIVARHYKQHLLNEFQFAAPALLSDGREDLELSIFETDFGARIGTLICMDALAGTGVELVSRYGPLDAIAMPTAWSDLFGLYFVSRVWHSGLAVHLGLNYLVANLLSPRDNMSGSGIYGPSGTAAYISDKDDEASRLLVARLPIHPKRLASAPVSSTSDAVSPILSADNCITQTIRTKKNSPLQLLSVLLELPADSGGGRPISNCVHLCIDSLCCSVSYSLDTPVRRFLPTGAELRLNVSLVRGGTMSFGNVSSSDVAFVWDSCALFYTVLRPGHQPTFVSSSSGLPASALSPTAGLYQSAQASPHAAQKRTYVGASADLIANEAHYVPHGVEVRDRCPNAFLRVRVEANFSGRYLFPGAEAVVNSNVVPVTERLRVVRDDSLLKVRIKN